MMKIRIVLFVSAVLAVFCFFQFWYPYHFFYHEQNQIFLWEWEYVSGYFQKSGGLRWVALASGLCVIAWLTVCHFSTSCKLSSTICVMGWLLFFWAVSAIRAKWLRLTCFLVMLLPSYMLFGTPKTGRIQPPDFVLEKDFAVDNEYRFGNYDKVLDIVKNSDGWTAQMLFFYNLVFAQRGQLPEHLFDFTPNNLGTFEKIGPETPRLTIINMNELYWALGDMTFTERAAMMTNVFAPENRNVRMMKRLAECNIVSGDSIAAQKYLRILGKTFVYSRWAEATQQHLAQGQLPPYLAQKKPFVNHRDTITISDNAHFLMMQLLDHNPDNVIALDYILCSDLLLKDITNFKRDYDRYCADRPRLKPLYQEALCIWLAGSNASQEEWQQYIKMNDVMQRFVEYNNQRGNPRFKGTYWYYFDKIKAPEI